MDIFECERKAQDCGYNSATFDLVNKETGARIAAKWLDAYFGLLQLEGQDGFIRAKDVAEIGPLVCENFNVPD